MNLRTWFVPFLAHETGSGSGWGWDEVLLLAIPIVVAVVAVRLVERAGRSNRRASDTAAKRYPENMTEDREPLDELQAELAKAAADGSTEAEEVLAHVEEYRNTPHPTDEQHRNLGQRLRESILSLETSHPDLSATIQSVVNSFTASGI